MSKHTKVIKPKIMQKHQIHKKDSGSPEVQVAILTSDIQKLTEHLIINPKDHSSRRGLLKKVGTRKRLLNYLLGEDKVRYLRTCKKNGIKPNLIVINRVAGAVPTTKDVDLEEGILVEEEVIEKTKKAT